VDQGSNENVLHILMVTSHPLIGLLLPDLKVSINEQNGHSLHRMVTDLTVRPIWSVLAFKNTPPHTLQQKTMPQTLDPVPNGQPDRLTCTYANYTSQIQVVRITNILNWYFERVVFPGQQLLFSAPGDAHLEIHTGMMASSILSDTLSCRDLAIPDTFDLPDRSLRPEALAA
jgi:hypothetical protein